MYDRYRVYLTQKPDSEEVLEAASASEAAESFIDILLLMGEIGVGSHQVTTISMHDREQRFAVEACYQVTPYPQYQKRC